MSFGGRWTGWSGTKPENRTNEERFWSQVTKHESGCWVWTGARDKDGYGVLNLPQDDGSFRVVKAHRYSLEKKMGKSIEGLIACHDCDNPPCCNPNHLYAGTQKENMADARIRGRIGTPAAKRIRALLMREASFTRKEVGAIFGVTPSAVRKWELR